MSKQPIENVPVLWLDVVNQDMERYAKENKIRPSFIHGTHELYPKALQVLWKYFDRNAEALEFNVSYSNCHMNYLNADKTKQFLTFFCSNFDYDEFLYYGYEDKTENCIQVPMQVYGIYKSDISLDNSFYDDHLHKWDALSQNEQLKFEELKDMHHERIYGDIERFDNLSHGWITANETRKKRFCAGLQDEIEHLIDSRNKRRYRFKRTLNYV